MPDKDSAPVADATARTEADPEKDSEPVADAATWAEAEPEKEREPEATELWTAEPERDSEPEADAGVPVTAGCKTRQIPPPSVTVVAAVEIEVAVRIAYAARIWALVVPPPPDVPPLVLASQPVLGLAGIAVTSEPMRPIARSPTVSPVRLSVTLVALLTICVVPRTVTEAPVNAAPAVALAVTAPLS